MPIVRMNPQAELSEFHPYLLAPRSLQQTVGKCARCGLVHWQPIRQRGMGSASSQQINAIVTTGASTTTAILGSLSLIPGPGWVAGAIAGLIAVGSIVANMFQGCGQTCVIAANDANKIEPLLQQNLQAYLSAPVHYASLQKAALNNFDMIWNTLTTACSDPSLGDAGKRCISDRQQGSCAYHTSPGGWSNGKYTAPGPNNSGSTCWNWFVGYRDPIANDPTVVPDPTAATAPGGNILGPVVSSAPSTGGLPSTISGFNWSALLIPGGLLALGLVLFMGARR
jgi:hypothetical protein